jgi:glutamyl endopeptidase
MDAKEKAAMNLSEVFPDTPIDFRRFSRELAQHEDLEDAVRGALDAEVTSRAVVFGGESLPPPIRRRDDSWIQAGIEAVRKTADDHDAALTAYESAALEAIVRLQNRPALLIRQASFAEPPDSWTRLNQFRTEICTGIPKVGRIDARPDDMVGTGFVVADGLIMTNRHVVECFADPAPEDGAPWIIHSSARPTVNFKMEYEEPAQAIFRIMKIEGVHPGEYTDLALLSVEQEAIEPAGMPLPPAVRLASSAPKMDSQLSLYAIGYPYTDNGDGTPPEVIESIYENIFQVKRLQPGEFGSMLAPYGAFSHDCSTLGGNSGSLLVDLARNQVIGLHFKGLYRRTNYAVALWLLKNDPLFHSRKLNYAD